MESHLSWGNDCTATVTVSGNYTTIQTFCMGSHTAGLIETENGTLGSQPRGAISFHSGAEYGSCEADLREYGGTLRVVLVCHG